MKISEELGENFEGENKMNKRYVVSIIVMIFIALPILAVVQSDSFKGFSQMDLEKCSLEIEGLKLCTSTPKLVVNSDDPVRLKLFWVNSTDKDRTISSASSYNLTITDEKEEKLIPVLQKKMRDGPLTNEDNEKLFRRIRGSDRGIYIEANQRENQEVWLTEQYDYDLTAKGKYYVTIRKTIPSLESEQTIEFVLDNIEIEVR